MTSDRGFALLIVLWAIVLLSLLATQLAATGRTEAYLAANLRAAAAAEAAADGAVQEAAYHLIDPQAAWPADGQPRVLHVPGATVTLLIENEGGKVNPNLAEPGLLRALIRRLGADTQTADSVADAMADWRFPGSQPRPHGAKAPQYRAAGLDYEPPGRPFSSLDELGGVLGMSRVLLAALRPYLTILTDTATDPTAAASVVRQAMLDVSGQLATTPAPVRTVTVVAQAAGDGGGHFTRRAALRLGRTAKEAPMMILTWDAIAAP